MPEDTFSCLTAWCPFCYHKFSVSSVEDLAKEAAKHIEKEHPGESSAWKKLHKLNVVTESDI